MIVLRIKGESQSKFVQNYLNTVKDAEAALNKNLSINPAFESMITQLSIKAPFFNYYISQRNHKGELISLDHSVVGSRPGSRISLNR